MHSYFLFFLVDPKNSIQYSVFNSYPNTTAIIQMDLQKNNYIKKLATYKVRGTKTIRGT